MMRVWIVSLLLIGSSIAFGAAPNDAAKTLRWKFVAGQKLRVETQSELTRTTKIKANVDETKIKSTINMIWEVKSVDEAGVATIEQRPERLAIILEDRLDQKYELDSDLLKKNPNLKGPDREALRVLMEGTATIKLDPRGVVMESSVPPDWSEKIKATSLAEFHDRLVSAATPQIMQGVQMNLPEGAVEEGAEWLVEAPKVEGTPAAPSGGAKFVYRGEKPLEGIPRDRIDIEFTIKDLAADITITSQANQGQFWFDAAEGRAITLVMSHQWKAEKMFRDNVILLTTSGTSTTTWSVVP